jgi:hypothetical protein
VSPGGFDFQIEVRSRGTLVGRTPASLAACREDVLFREIVSGRHPNDGSEPTVRLSPVWDDDPPAVRAVDLAVGGESTRYEKNVFASQATGCVADLLRARLIDADTPVEWRVVAAEQDPTPRKLRAQVSRTPLPIEIGPVPQVDDGCLLAEIDEPLLDELRAEYSVAGRIERAWLLSGRVRTEPARAATSVYVREAVPVETHEDGASESHFHFEPSALVRARNIARERHPGSIGVGWLHTHPACEACAATPACEVDLRFFSAPDVEVHTTAFSSPFMIGLVIAKAGDKSVAEPGVRAYGWSGARVREVPLRVRQIGSGQDTTTKNHEDDGGEDQ